MASCSDALPSCTCVWCHRALRTPHAVLPAACRQPWSVHVNKAQCAKDMQRLQALLGVLNIPLLTVPWLEAKDVAALLSQAGVRQGWHVHIATNDEDLMQLVTETSSSAASAGGSAGAPAAHVTMLRQERSGKQVPVRHP